jgi:hypothetical protein
MHVNGAGLPRTGTLTQKLALEKLGFAPCYHWVNLIADLDEVELWHRLLDGEELEEQIFGGYGATVDWPGGFIHRELAARYPDAKVLLSVRDSRAWARSMHDTIWGVLYDHGSMAHHLAAAQGFIDPAMHAYTELMTDMLNRAGLFGPAPARFDEDALVAGIEQHNAEVRAAVPAGQLLEWSPADGWGPLCEFLERPAPAARLPRVNDSSSFNAMISASAMQKLTAWWSRQPDPTLPGPAPAIP